MLREEDIFAFVKLFLKMLCFSSKNQTKPSQNKNPNHTLSGVVEGKLGTNTLRWNKDSGAGGQEEGDKWALLRGISSMMLPPLKDISNIVIEKGNQPLCVLH